MKTQAGSRSLKRWLGDVNSLSFGPGNRSITVDGIKVHLDDAARFKESRSIGCDFGVERRPGAIRRRSRTWVSWKDDPILCIPDDISWNIVESRGKCLAAVHGAGNVSFFTIDSPSNEG